jgi:hypothetical protein
LIVTSDIVFFAPPFPRLSSVRHYLRATSIRGERLHGAFPGAPVQGAALRG